AAILFMGLADDTVIGQNNTAAKDTALPQPSFPKINKYNSVEELMPVARELARNKNAFLGRGFGEINDGEKIIIVTTTSDPGAEMYIEAALRALKERNIQV